MVASRIWRHVLLSCLVLCAAPVWGQHGDPEAMTVLTREVAADMVAIPAGTFRMGDLQGQGFTFEQPVHRVSMPAFRLARHDVTFAQYDLFARATGRPLPEQRVGFGRRALPVVNVSWVDAQAFIAWLNQSSGHRYRLPTEAEWEYAARGGSTSAYPWGDSFEAGKANAMGTAGPDRWDGPAPVGSFPPNAFGLYDMIGNVSQWVEDRKHNDYNGAPTDGSAWNTGDPNWRMVRGGSWVMGPKGLRVSLRIWDDVPRRAYQSMGFRLAQGDDDRLTPLQESDQRAASAPPARPAGGTGEGNWYHRLQDGQGFATEKLAHSPRRGEWITISSLGRPLKAWVVYPDKAKGKMPVVLVLHEVFGLTDSTRNTADEIAAMGYIAIAPDMLSGLGPNGGGTDSFTSEGGGALNLREDADVYKDLEALMDYGKALPGASDKVGIVGLTWGGGVAFRYAVTHPRSEVKVVLDFCGAGPPIYGQGPSHMNRLINDWKVNHTSVPVYAFYAEWDLTMANPVLLTADDSKHVMEAAGNHFEAVIYPRAEHAFLRVGEDPADRNPANAVADKAALIRIAQILKQSF